MQSLPMNMLFYYEMATCVLTAPKDYIVGEIYVVKIKFEKLIKNFRFIFQHIHNSFFFNPTLDTMKLNIPKCGGMTENLQ